MNMSRLFPMSVNPIHEGVYQHQRSSMGTLNLGYIFYSLWKDGEWKMSDNSLAGALKATKRGFSPYDGKNAGWQGISENIWRDPTELPVNSGAYEVDFEGGSHEYQFFDAYTRKWYYGTRDPVETANRTSPLSFKKRSVERRWRFVEE